jgi:hypothetical protein
MKMSENEVRLTGYNFIIVYDGVEYNISADVCLDVMTHPDSIIPNPFNHNHTPMEIKEYVEETFMNGLAIGLN